MYTQLKKWVKFSIFLFQNPDSNELLYFYFAVHDIVHIFNQFAMIKILFFVT